MNALFRYLLILTGLLIMSGCNNNSDPILGKGEIRYEGKTYLLNKMTLTSTPTGTGSIIGGEIHYTYSHELAFSSTNGRSFALIRIGSKDNELQPGEYFWMRTDIHTEGNEIQNVIELSLIFADYDDGSGSPTIKVTRGKTNDGLHIEFDHDGLFFEWEGVFNKEHIRVVFP